MFEWFSRLPTWGKIAIPLAAAGVVVLIWEPWKKKSAASTATSGIAVTQSGMVTQTSMVTGPSIGPTSAVNQTTVVTHTSVVTRNLTSIVNHTSFVTRTSIVNHTTVVTRTSVVTRWLQVATQPSPTPAVTRPVSTVSSAVHAVTGAGTGGYTPTNLTPIPASQNAVANLTRNQPKNVSVPTLKKGYVYREVNGQLFEVGPATNGVGGIIYG